MCSLARCVQYWGLNPLPPLSMFKYPWKAAINNATGLPNPLSNEFSVAYRWSVELRLAFARC